jgi:pimeloyl-ACP methyl ester carboxylesterase
MSAIHIGDDLVHYEVLGRGRPVILLHSWIGSWRYWIPTMQQLQLKYRVYALDLYGYGDSGKNPQKYTLEHQAQLLADFTDQLGIEKTALVGHGLGAMVALEYANQYKDRGRVPRMLIVSAPLFDPGDLTHRAKEMTKIVAAQKARAAAPASRDVFSEATMPSASTAMRAALQEARIRANGGEIQPAAAPSATALRETGDNPLQTLFTANTGEQLLARCFKKSEPEYDKLQVDVARADARALKFGALSFDSGRTLDMLRLLSTPTVVVHGIDDGIIPLPDENVWNYLTAERDDTLLPVHLSGVRHFPMLEHERFLRLLNDFLEAPDISKLEIKERWKRRTR